MYRIVVADDEQIEREALQSALERYFDGECVIETAANGRAALEAVRRLHADIAVLDIEMPGMSGLDASRMIRAEQPDCRVVFLTAYGEFDYARQAVEIGAVDYLLKPCSDTELFGVIARLTARIEAQREEEHLRELSTQKIENLTQWVEEQLVLTIMGGYLRPEWVQGQLAELGIAFCNGAVSIFSSPDGLAPERIREILKGRVWPDWLHLITYEYDGRLYVLSISSRENDCVERMWECFCELSDKLLDISNKRLYVAVGRGFDDLRGAQSSFFEAQAALSRCGDGQFAVRFGQGENSGEAASGKGGLSETACRGMLEGDATQAVEAMHMALEALCAQQLDFAAIIEKMERRVARLLAALQQETGVDYLKRYDPHSLLLQAQDTDGVLAAAETLLRELTAEVSGSRGGRMTQIMQEIEDYIKGNYQRDIFLQQVAREMNYSDAYFSKLFKQCFNKNFVTYLTEARVEAAKDLLKNPTANIKEIGEQVGYKDSNYFTKVFRRATGQSPSEYRANVTPASFVQENRYS